MDHSHHSMTHDHSGHHGGTPVVHTSVAETSASHDMGMHAMTFHFGYEQFVLFHQWSAETALGLSITCFFFFILAILYEFIKAYRRVISVKSSERTLTHLQRTGSSRRISHNVSTNTQNDVNIEPTTHADNKIVMTGDSTIIVSASGTNAADVDGSLNSSVSGNSHNGRQKLVRDRNDHSVYVAEGYSNPNQQDFDVEMHRSAGDSSTANQYHQSDRLHVNGNVGQHEARVSAPPCTLKSTTRVFASKDELYSLRHLFGTLLYTVQVIMAYLLMLAFMLFNVWICAAILAGAAIGHFFLAQKAAIAVDDHPNEDHCH